jgi:prepilin-type processing-associated H-X9-DG protein
MRLKAFSLLETITAITVIVILGACLAGAGWSAFKSSSLAVSANNLRQLSAGSAAYLAENNYTFWPYVSSDPSKSGRMWWFGFEPAASPAEEGKRLLDPSEGPLGPYVPGGLRPDPSFRFSGKPFKPKFQFGYIGIGYNVKLGSGWLGKEKKKTYWELPEPGRIVVFATSAQVNTFQAPASSKNPMIEEFYGLSETDVTVHFRHGGSAMVGFADGSCGFLPMDKSTLDSRAPQAAIGRFAPLGSTKYLLPESPP